MKNIFLAGAALAAAFALPAQAAVTLDFEGNGDFTFLGDFYNGGAGGNYGIRSVAPADTAMTFTTAAAQVRDVAFTPSGVTAMGIIGGDRAVINVVGGFEGGLSTWYSAARGSSIEIYDDLLGRGNLLATLTLSSQHRVGCESYQEATHCNWSKVSGTFAGIGKSIVFRARSQDTFLDDLTFGLEPTAVVPEPASWAMMIMGFGLSGALLRRRRALAPV